MFNLKQCICHFRIAATVSIIFISLMFVSCSSTNSFTSTEKGVSSPLQVEGFKRNLAYEGVDRDPVIFIPGFSGSSLVTADTHNNVWGSFRGLDAIRFSDEQLYHSAYPMVYGRRIEDVDDNVVADRVLQTYKIRFLGFPLTMEAYKDLADILVRGGYVPANKPLPPDKHFYSLFEFPYDWRKDIPSAAAELGEFIKQKRAYLQSEYERLYGIKNYDVKFDIIGHSMGGLIARYYLMYGEQDLPDDGSLPKLTWEGSRYIGKIIMSNVNNGGELVDFFSLQRGGGMMPFPAITLATYPTCYQQMPPAELHSFLYSDDPNGKPIDIFDVSVWVKMGWGLAAPDADASFKIMLPGAKTPEERKKIAIDHLDKCLKRAKQFISAMAVPGAPPNDVKMHLFLGYGIPTSKRAYFNRSTGNVDKVTYDSGDGVVLATSALYVRNNEKNWSFFLDSPIHWDRVTILRNAHMGIVSNDPTFADNLLFTLLCKQKGNDSPAQR